MELDAVAVRREAGRHLALQRLDVVVGVSAGEAVEHRGDLDNARPLRSSAAIVLAKLGAAVSPAIASTSAICSAIAVSKAGSKWAGRIAANGGVSAGPLQASSSGLAPCAAALGEDEVMRSSIWFQSLYEPRRIPSPLAGD